MQDAELILLFLASPGSGPTPPPPPPVRSGWRWVDPVYTGPQMVARVDATGPRFVRSPV